MAQQAYDAIAVLDQIGAERPYIFESSAGGTIACQIVEAHAERILGTVVHEPAIQASLPDAVEILLFFDAVDGKLAAEDTMPAMRMSQAACAEYRSPPKRVRGGVSPRARTSISSCDASAM